MSNFRELFTSLAPPWLRAYWGERMWGVYALMSDLITEGSAQAIKAHMLREDTSPDDALPLVGADRRMPRYDGETNLQYRNRMIDAWDAYELGGTAAAITGQLELFGLDNTRCISQHGGWAFENPVDTTNWSRFVVIIEQTHPWTAGPGNYGTGLLYGSALTYGTDATPGELDTVLGIIKKWKPGHSKNPYVLVVLDGDYYGQPALTYGGGSTYSATADTVKWWNEP